MNNNTNNNVNNQPLNNQNNSQSLNPATQQFVQSSQINNNMSQNSGQPINPVTQQFQQPIQQQPVTQQQMQNNYQQPMNNVNHNMNQMYNYNNLSNNQNNMLENKPKNNKKLFIIIGISVAVVIAIVVLVLVLNNGSKNKTVNDYEDNGYQENENNNVTNTETNSDTQTYKGFKFSKVSGYIYGEEEGLLTVQSSNYFVALGVTKVSFVDVKANYASLVSVLSSSGMTVGQAKCDSYNGNEVVTYEIYMDGVNAIYYILSSPNSSYVYEGYVVNRTNTVDYENINLVVSIANSSTYVGDYSNYSTEFGFDFELKEMEE